MDKEKEHIIADKTMLRVARVTSIFYTVSGVSGVIPVFLSPYHADTL
jgi:hypothetical protein